MISGFSSFSSTTLMLTLSSNTKKLEDLTVQLSTQKKAQTYGGLGGEVSKALDFRAQINSISGYQSAIEQAQLQISMMNVALERLVDIGSEVSGSAKGTEYDITSNNQSVSQMTAATLAKEALSLLDTEVDGDYVFSGKTSDTQPTLSYDQIINGFNGQDGLIAVTDERIRADAGADGKGRLTTGVVGTTMTIAEEATVFGYKLDTVSSTLSNATVTGPAGVPPSISVDLTGMPKMGEALSFSFTLPDGSTETINLTGRDGATSAGDGYFSLSGTPASVATAIENELAYQIQQNVLASGEAASRIRASEDFFLTANGAEPLRVVGSPPETATTLDTATVALKPTVNWYVGDNDTQSSRDTATAQVDSRLSVSYGARANEDSIAREIAYVMAFSLPTYDADSSLDKNRYAAFADSIASNLSSVQQGNVVKTIVTEIGVANKVMNDANARHMTTSSVLMGMRDEIEGINEEEVAAKIMTLKTTIEASYQATSMIYQLSLTNYM